MNETIRIIGGQYRGKKLQFPAINGLRPTPDRVRETLFNWLMHSIRNARCLDAFAGSGALGFEAFSRDAAKVVLIEQNTLAFANLNKIAQGFNSPKLSVIKTNAITYINQTKESFDLIFLDPPFAQLELFKCIEAIAVSDILVPGGLLYVESPTVLSLDELQWENIKLKQAGHVVYGLYKKRRRD
jgi:16S rRNA (guanine966-N2)-methyltransferase